MPTPSTTPHKAAILGVIRFQHHRDMGVGSAGIGAQAAAHFQPGELGQHPVDKGPHRPFDQSPRPFGPQPVKGKAPLIVHEILKAFAKVASQEDIDDVHACPALLSAVGVAQVCDAFVTGLQQCERLRFSARSGPFQDRVRPPSTTSVCPVI